MRGIHTTAIAMALWATPCLAQTQNVSCDWSALRSETITSLKKTVTAYHAVPVKTDSPFAVYKYDTVISDLPSEMAEALADSVIENIRSGGFLRKHPGLERPYRFSSKLMRDNDFDAYRVTGDLFDQENNAFFDLISPNLNREALQNFLDKHASQTDGLHTASSPDGFDAVVNKLDRCREIQSAAKVPQINDPKQGPGQALAIFYGEAKGLPSQPTLLSPAPNGNRSAEGFSAE
jgi:hypothetical protein